MTMLRMEALLAMALLAVAGGCGSFSSLLGSHKPEPPLAQNALLADNRSGLEKGVDQVKGAVASTFGSGDKPKDAKQPEETSLFKKSQPPGPAFWVAMAQINERSGNFTGAETNYQRALQRDGSHLEAMLGYARMHDRQGKFAEAVRLYEQAVRRHPRSATAHNDYALCLVRQRKPAGAAPLLTKAVELDPKKSLYRNNLARVLVQVGREEEAWRHLAVAHPPAVAHYNMGWLLSRYDQLPAARKHFAEAVKVDPTMVAARQWLDADAAKHPTMAHQPGPNAAPGDGAIVRHELGAPRFGNPGQSP